MVYILFPTENIFDEVLQNDVCESLIRPASCRHLMESIFVFTNNKSFQPFNIYIPFFHDSTGTINFIIIMFQMAVIWSNIYAKNNKMYFNTFSLLRIRTILLEDILLPYLIILLLLNHDVDETWQYTFSSNQCKVNVMLKFCFL